MNLSCSLVKITLSDTEVESPYSVDDAATAAVPTPTAAATQPCKASDASKRIQAETRVMVEIWEGRDACIDGLLLGWYSSSVRPLKCDKLLLFGQDL